MQTQRHSNDPKTAQAAGPSLLSPYFATPHDQALSAMHNQVGIADLTPMSSPDVLQDSTSYREVLTDPYDGTPLGISILNKPFSTDPFVNSKPFGSKNEDNAKDQSRDEELWTQLSRITDLQTEIARMHLDMEGISVGKGKGKLGDSKNRRQRKSGEGSRQSQTDAGLEEYDVEGGISMDDEETEQNRARQEEFAKLADQFEGRKESINDIMTKLDDLSKALTEFHALQAPEIKMPSSRDLSTEAMRL